MIFDKKPSRNMKFNKKTLIAFLIAFVISIGMTAKENVPNPNMNTVTYSKVAAGCSPASSQTDLDVNNVRATILGGGDMWWNLSDAQYEIPKWGGINSLFAGSLWIGGVDAWGQLKVVSNDLWQLNIQIYTAHKNV